MGKKRNKKPTYRLKWVPKTPQGEIRNWLELPRDVTVSILSRLGTIDILENVQRVCMAWRDVCKDPLMWRTIDMGFNNDMPYYYDPDKTCRNLVDRSSGNAVDIRIDYFGMNDLLEYITNSCGGIRRLRLSRCYNITSKGLSNVASRLALLEELEISLGCISNKTLEVIGRACPLLKSFKFNNQWHQFSDIHAPYLDDALDDDDDDDFEGDYGYEEAAFIDNWNENYYREIGGAVIDSYKDCEALAIAQTMRGLRHLQLVGNQVTNDGLKEILDSCPDLESLDLRQCYNLQLKGGDLGKRCAERIKELRLPDDPLHDYEFAFEAYAGDDGYGFSDAYEGLDYDRYEDYYYDDRLYDSDDSDYYDDFTKLPLFDEDDFF